MADIEQVDLDVEPAPDLAAGHTEAPGPRGWAVVLFRTMATLSAIIVAAQPVLAGRMLGGDYGSLAAHRTNGIIAFGVGVGQVVAALLLWLPGRGPAGLFIRSLLVVAFEALQIHEGFSRDLAVHIPLGVALVLGTVIIMERAWKLRAGTVAESEGSAE
jgi:hypothetical protein